jgi:hypothetical protein
LSQPRPGDQRVSVLKPLHLFSMRGRRDPFRDTALWSPAGAADFNISGLMLKGFIEVDGQSIALFVSIYDRAAYTLRGGQLFGANQKAVPGVVGRIISKGKEARLRQGELSLTFSALRESKRKLP